MSFDPRAEDAFAAFVADCGRDAYKMQTTCETVLSRYLAKYPVELELLIAALRVGVPKKIAAHDGLTPYDDFLSRLADKFVVAASTDREAATWAVGAWAFALGKPIGYVAPEADPRAGRVYDDPEPPAEAAVARRLMTLIVTAGGALGGFLGALFLPAIMLAVDAAEAVDGGGYGYSGRNIASVTAVVVVLVSLFAGFVGGLAALGGWYMGGGDERPWASFAVAFGTAFSSLLVLLFIPCIPFLLKPVFFFGSVFGATYKSAARGGNY